MVRERELALGGCRILLVEDEYFLADDLARALSDRGATIEGPYPTIEDALEAVESDTCLDLAVIDLNLRGMPGFPVAAALRSREIPFVFVTGFDQTFVPATYDNVPRFEKPVNVGNLVSRLAEMRGVSRRDPALSRS